MLDVNSTLQRLHELSLSVNEASDLLNQEVTRIELKLEARNLGIPVWYAYDSSHAVGYAKIGNRWGIGICDCENSQEYLFSSAPRAWRIRAADHIPDLVATLVENGSSLLLDLGDAIKSLKKVLP